MSQLYYYNKMIEKIQVADNTILKKYYYFLEQLLYLNDNVYVAFSHEGITLKK